MITVMTLVISMSFAKAAAMIFIGAVVTTVHSHDRA